MSTDAQHIQATLEGDAQAFGNLVRKYQDRLFNAFCRITSCREEAEDVVQEALVQAFVKLESFEKRSAFYTWLYRIALNVSVSRKRRKRPVISVDAEKLLTGREPIDPAESASQQMEQRESVQSLYAALNRLSQEHRKILVLREIDQLDYETIGEILELPVGTVRSRLHRARLQLRTALETPVKPSPRVTPDDA